jgi:hypothetical protein
METTIRPQSVWTRSLSVRQARAVARVLREAGYAITIEQVRSLTFVNAVAEYCEPGDLAEQHRVRRLICEAAGIQPRLAADNGE